MLQHELDAFVWSKMGTEAGEPLEYIMHRKEIERQANGGKFVWGIGNSPGNSIVNFMQDTKKPVAIFTETRPNSKTRSIDEEESERVWRDKLLPRYSFVTSHPERKEHYALLCECDEDLRTQCHGKLNSAGVVNYESGIKPGPSQVTSLVKYAGEKGGYGDYPIRFVASLYGEGWVTLTDYADISPETIKEVKRSADDGDIEKWKALINKIKGE